MLLGPYSTDHPDGLALNSSADIGRDPINAPRDLTPEIENLCCATLLTGDVGPEGFSNFRRVKGVVGVWKHSDSDSAEGAASMSIWGIIIGQTSSSPTKLLIFGG